MEEMSLFTIDAEGRRDFLGARQLFSLLLAKIDLLLHDEAKPKIQWAYIASKRRAEDLQAWTQAKAKEAYYAHSYCIKRRPPPIDKDWVELLPRSEWGKSKHSKQQ